MSNERSPLWMWLACSLALMTGASCTDSLFANDTNGYLSLTLQSSASPKIGDVVSYKASVTFRTSESTQLVKSYSWIVTDPAGKEVKRSVSAGEELVTFTPATFGTHRTTCTAFLEDDSTLSSSVTIYVLDPSFEQRSYTARVVPLPSSGLPPKDVHLTVGGGSQSGLTWTLDPGQEVSLEVVGSGSAAPMPAVVRLLRTASDPRPRDIYLSTGVGKVRLAGSFHALVIPDAATAAPDLFANKAAAALGSTWKISLDSGEQIKGTVLRHDASPLADAAVSIHTVDKGTGVRVPSTVSRTLSDGSFAVRTRVGVAEVTVAPPAASGLPIAVVKGASLEVKPGAPSWSFTFGDLKPAKISGKVTQHDGQTPAAGARVVMVMDGKVQAGTLLVGGTSLQATGVYRRDLTTTAAGELQDPKTGSTLIAVPPGTYRVDLWPGQAESATQGFASVKVDTAASAGLSLKLSSRVKLSGVVEGPGPSGVKAQITATSGVGQFSTTSGAAGAYQLLLDDKMTYELVVRPIGVDQPLSRYIASSVSVAGDLPHFKISLSRALSLSGRVTNGGAGIPGASIRIWCSGAGCPSAATADETQTGADGSFELLVPPSPKK